MVQNKNLNNNLDLNPEDLEEEGLNDVADGYLTPYTVGLLDKDGESEIKDYIFRINRLPKTTLGIACNFSTAEFIEEHLGPNFGLDANQKAELTRILRDILLADLFWGDFPEEISRRLQLDADTANQIVKFITEQLLAPALEEIKAMQKTKFPDRISQNREGQTPQSLNNTDSPNQGNVINLRKQN